MNTIKKYLLILLIAAAALAASFGAGRYLTPDKIVKDVVEVKVRDEEYTKQKVEEARAQWTWDAHLTTITTSVVTKACPPPTTEPYVCKPPCATDCSKCPSQTVSTTTTTTADSHATGASTNASTTTEHGASHESNTTHATVTSPNSGIKGWRLSLVASGTLFDGKSLAFTPSYGATVGYKLLGPVSLSVSAYTTKTAVGSLVLDLGEKWQVSADAGTSFTKLTPFYGGTVSRRLFGPIWVSGWGTSDRTAGISASFRVQ